MTLLNGTMVPIQTITVGAGGQAEIEFTNIPQTYTDLQILYSARTSGSTGYSVNLRMTFNNSTSRYYERLLYKAGDSVGSVSKNNTDPYLNWSALAQDALTGANIYGSGQFYITNYTSNVGKSISSEYVSEDNNTSPWIMMNAGLWDPVSNVPITSIKLTPSVGSFVQHSTVTLYGVRSAGYGAKATGGAIYQDTNYFYHMFSASGTFSPTQSISADILIVGGGGGGGCAFGGGGGSGGLLGFTSQSLTAQNYTVTIGGGGAGSTSESSKGSNGSNSVFGSLTTCTGGGGGGSYQTTSGANGGSGGGAAGDWNGGNGTFTGGTGTSGQGFAGGDGYKLPPVYRSGGGGGSTAVGQTLTSTSGGGNGGAGNSTYSSWATATSTGSNGAYAGGGGGGGFAGNNLVAGIGSAGGGNGGFGTVGSSAIALTGSGGGGGSGGAAWNGGNGGSGIVIIRYPK